MSLTLLYIVIARSVSDVPAHRSAVLWHAGLPAEGWLWQAGVAIRACVARQSHGDLPEIPSPAEAGSE
jgi:hypothetical protein